MEEEKEASITLEMPAFFFLFFSSTTVLLLIPNDFSIVVKILTLKKKDIWLFNLKSNLFKLKTYSL
jgi:hypothetical protein